MTRSFFNLNNLDRRKFMRTSLQTAGVLSLTGFTSQTKTSDHTHLPTVYTVQQMIDLILKEGNLSPLKETVDTIKCGSPDQIVSGIVTTMFPTIPVIEKAAALKANFIIAHEPSFYNHSDSPDWVRDNAVLKEKQAMLEKHKIAIWRFHDYCHALKPDAVSYGAAKKAGWLPYYKTGEVMLKIPKISFKNLTSHLQKTLGIAHLRVIGDPDFPCERIALLPGAWGGQRQVSVAEKEKPDVLIVGETPEWETVEYIRDARALGHKISLVVLGHAVSEEPGMEWFAEWLKPKIPEVNITHLESKDPFTWV